MNPVESLPAFIEFVRAEPLGVVATTSPDGPQAALVSFAATPAGDLLFNTRSDARKVCNLADDQRVALVIGCAGDVSIQIEGDAVVESGAALAASARTFSEWFPGSRADADGFSVVRVAPRWIRYYDAASTPATIVERAGWT